VTDMSGTVELRGTAAAVVTPAQWQQRADELRSRLVSAGLPPEAAEEDLREAFGGITFRDPAGGAWRHDGRSWGRWGGGQWEPRLPPPQLVLDKGELAVDAEGLGGPDGGADEWAPPDDMPFAPTHLVPPGGLRAWSAPDPSVPPASSLDGMLDVELLESRPDRWAHVRCANGWTAWLDGAELLPLTASP